MIPSSKNERELFLVLKKIKIRIETMHVSYFLNTFESK